MLFLLAIVIDISIWQSEVPCVIVPYAVIFVNNAMKLDTKPHFYFSSQHYRRFPIASTSRKHWGSSPSIPLK
jgi:hypothetical protein